MLYDYIALERVRCEDRVEISFETKGNFSDYKIPPLLLMPFIQNAFKHGIDMQMTVSYIKISICLDINKLQLQVDNNFTRNEVADPKAGGIGIQNVKRRLHHYFSDRHTLIIKPDSNNFSVKLFLSLDPNTTNEI